MSIQKTPAASAAAIAERTSLTVVFAIAFSHLLNDTLQSLIPAIFPLVKENYQLNFTQVGLIAVTFQLAASLLQPLVGHFTDRRPKPYSLSMGMAVSLSGLFLLSFAPTFAWLLVGVGLIGTGSSIFHPEASRVTFLAASDDRRGLAQAIFQVGGAAGSALGPLFAAVVVVALGQSHIWWFGVLALIAIAVLFRVGRWYQRNLRLLRRKTRQVARDVHAILPRRQVIVVVSILLTLIFSKYFYLASMTSYLTFYLIAKFDVSIATSQIYLFIFLISIPIGNLLGGPLGDRFGRKYVIWFSILGAAPFTLALPHVNLMWTAIFTVCIGLILSSAFPAILVYAQELLPGNIGMISGLFYGFAFGMGGVGSGVLGVLADRTNIFFVYAVCAYLPLIGLIAAFLPRLHHRETS